MRMTLSITIHIVLIILMLNTMFPTFQGTNDAQTPAVIPLWSKLIIRTSEAMYVSFSCPLCYFFKALM